MPESRDHALLQSRLEQAKRCSVLYQTEDLRRHKDGSPQRFLDSGFRRKDEAGAADIQWQIAARVLSMRLGLQPRQTPGRPMSFLREEDARLGGLDAVRV